jgi:hypothetical protein
MIKDGNKFRKKQLLTITLLFFTTLLSNCYKRQMMLQNVKNKKILNSLKYFSMENIFGALNQILTIKGKICIN